MKAYVLHGVSDLRYEDVDKPGAEADTVVVKMEAVGVCGSDIPRIYQTGAYSHPLIPGHEFSGVVAETGARAERSWLGKRVGVFPLLPCMECPQCRKRQYEMCRHYSYLGSRTDGGFAEYVRVPVWNLIELPDNVTFEQAAMLEPMAVAMHAIRRVEVSAGESVAICGLGTIGLLAAMLLRGLGNSDIYVIGNKQIQKKMAVTLGIPKERFCDARDQDTETWIMERTGGCGVDVFLECVGRCRVLEEAVRCTAPGGRVMLVGNPASDMQLAKNDYWSILRKQLVLMGTWNSSFIHEDTDDWHACLELLREERIHPEWLITHKFTMEYLSSGMECMRDKTDEYVKVMGYAQV